MPAKSGIFLKYGCIVGESTDTKHKEEIEISHFNYGLSNSADPGSGTEGATTPGLPDFHDFTFAKEMDKTSTPLFLECCNGNQEDEATICIQNGSGDDAWDLLTITLKKVAVVNYSVSSPQPGERPMETVSLRAGVMIQNYTPAKTGGKGKGAGSPRGWDLTTNKQC
jgi:type VI secretion system secreted protein Hcp